MLHHYLACLVFLVSGVLIGADSALTDPTNTFLRPDTAKIGSIDVSRLLRTNKSSFQRGREERVGGFSFSTMVKSMFTSSTGMSEKLQKWLEKETSVDTVFKTLHLNKPGYPFDKPNFAAWIEYANTLSAKFPEMSAISTLTKHYGDDFLYEIIQSAKKRPDTKQIAIELVTAQMQHWIRTRKDPDEFFRLLQLNSKGRKVFENPEFITWTKYVDDLNIKHPEEPTWMYSTLTTYFKDGELFQMTDVAKDLTNTKTIANKVEDDWLHAVLQKHKTPYQLLQNLGLGKTTDNLLDKVVYGNSLIRTWDKYMEAFNRRYPEEKTTMMETFTKAFGDDGVVKMLHTAKSKSWTRDLAAQLETTQLKIWLDSGKTTDDVFNLLKLDKQPNSYNFRDNQILSTWVSYINVFIEKNPAKKDTLFSALQPRFNDIRLNQILNMAKKYSSLESTATKIQTAKLMDYRVRNESPSRVFALLGLMDEGDHILNTSQFKSWMKYVEDFNKRNHEQESWFRPLNDAYNIEGMLKRARKTASTTKIDKMLESEWIKFWVGDHLSPKYTFQHLGIRRIGGNTFSSPAFKIWTKYLNAFNKQYPKEKVTMIEGLRANYHDINLLTIFEKAKTDPTTEKLVIDLENALVNKWIVEKKSLTYLNNQYGHEKFSDDIIQRYVKKVTAMTGNPPE